MTDTGMQLPRLAQKVAATNVIVGDAKFMPFWAALNERLARLAEAEANFEEAQYGFRIGADAEDAAFWIEQDRIAERYEAAQEGGA